MKILLNLAAVAAILIVYPNEINGLSIMDLLPTSITGTIKDVDGIGKDDIALDDEPEGDLLGIVDSDDEDRHHNIETKPHKLHLQGLFHKPLHKPHHKPQHEEYVQKPKPVILKTKTLVLEVTKTLVRNPVCMTVHGIKPPCSVPKIHEAHPHPPGAPHTPECKEETARFVENGADIDDEDDLFEDVFQDVQPAESVKSLSPVSTSFLYNEDEFDDTDEDSERAGRFLSLKRTPAISPSVKSVINEDELEQEESSDQEEKGLGKFFFNKPETRWITKTIWVTKVQKVTDYGVTATLAAVNCVPNNPHIPKCHGEHVSHSSSSHESTNHHQAAHNQHVPINHPIQQQSHHENNQHYQNVQQHHENVQEHHQPLAQIHNLGQSPLIWKEEETKDIEKSKVVEAPEVPVVEKTKENAATESAKSQI